jgi:surfactin synthase thioesterase subunit
MADESKTPEQHKAERLQAQADSLKAKAEQASERAFGMYGRFAGGQPLLVGHHSYRSARRAKNRADAASERAIDAYKAAERAQAKAKHAKAHADAKAEIAAFTGAQSRPWEPSDFRKGDIVTVRTFETSIDTYRVKRVNQKTLTLDGGGGGWDDPRREYDRVLSRTRDGVTITNPAEEDPS